jgi:tetratricopeptide (TPR) repeat protein
MSWFDVLIATTEILTHFQRGCLMERLGKPEKALCSFERCLDLCYHIPENFRHGSVPKLMLEACFRISKLHYEKGRNEEAVKAIHRYQDIHKQLRKTESGGDEADDKLLCSRVLGENAGMFGISEQLAKEAIRAAVPSTCRVFGAVECANQIDDWYFKVYSKLTAKELANKDESEEVIAIYRRFLDIYVELHDTESLKVLHSNHESFIGYYRLALLYDRAFRHLNAVEAWKMCLLVCEKLWASTHSEKLLGYYVNAWINLSYSYRQLGCYLESAKASRRGIDLAEEFPGKCDDFLFSADDVKTEYMRACQRLWSYGDKVRPDERMSVLKAEAKEPGNPTALVRIEQACAEQAQNRSFAPQNQKLRRVLTKWWNRKKHRGEALLLLSA